MLLFGKLNESTARASSMVSLVLCCAGIFFVLTFALLTQLAWGQRIGTYNQQRSKAISVDDRLHSISTLIHSSWPGSQSSASGFFYRIMERDPKGPPSKDGLVWLKIAELWLVTNRHVLVSETSELASSIIFHHRKITEKGYEWVPITISGTDLHSRSRFHQSDDVDVAVVSVLDLLVDVITLKRENETPMGFQAVSKDLFPGTNKMISVGVGVDALVVGYPRGFYDKFSKFPIVKSGVIASKWGMPFGGKPYFLIDAKLFPGSSGSLVISRPTDLVVQKGQVYAHSSGSKEFLFLGIYSGEYFHNNLGIVWYYHLIPTIISEGKQHPSKPE